MMFVFIPPEFEYKIKMFPVSPNKRIYDILSHCGPFLGLYSELS